FCDLVLGVALGDLPKLVAPKRFVLFDCNPFSSEEAKAEFDARCYRTIFAADRPDTDFVSVGNSSDVMADRLEIGKAIQTIVAGTKIVRLIDRDDRSAEEITDAQAVGVRVLSRRHIESYLADDEILAALCIVNGNPGAVAAVLAAKQAAIAASVQRGNPPDDMKSAVGELYGAIRRILQLVGSGNTVDAFLRDTLAPLVTPNTNTYCQMRSDIFGV
ncbi:MAG: AAA family ATPase, partial [Thermomicrobiales bacterium]